jgi:dienelactone hydrolase
MLIGGLLTLWSATAAAQELVHFRSLEPSAPLLDGYLFRPAGVGRHPALVFLHGCGGLISRSTERINTREADWAARFNADGYVVLMVDSLGPRHHGDMCSVHGFDIQLYHQRPKDAYGALAWLQAQDFIRPDRVGLVGWSEGGGVILYSIGAPSLGRQTGSLPTATSRSPSPSIRPHAGPIVSRPIGRHEFRSWR